MRQHRSQLRQQVWKNLGHTTIAAQLAEASHGVFKEGTPRSGARSASDAVRAYDERQRGIGARTGGQRERSEWGHPPVRSRVSAVPTTEMRGGA